MVASQVTRTLALRLSPDRRRSRHRAFVDVAKIHSRILYNAGNVIGARRRNGMDVVIVVDTYEWVGGSPGLDCQEGASIGSPAAFHSG